MKYTSIAVMALLGNVSATKLSKQQAHLDDYGYVVLSDVPSNEVANGDRDEDRQLEDERDVDDDVVQDNGFAARSSWVQLNAHHKHAHKHSHKHRKPSDDVANGDRDEDRQLEDERDGEDHVVQDHGFAARSSWAQKSARHQKKHREVPSNEVANGDRNENRQLEDERDVNDDVVADTGFASRSSWAQKNARHQKKHREVPSNEVANGDKNENRQLEDERDVNDDVVADTGFASRSSWAQKSARHLAKSRDVPSNEVANGDRDEDRQLEDERDGEDYVVQDHGFAARSSWAQMPKHHRNRNYIQLSENPSDEVANGDAKEDLQVESERDDDDAVVQDNGFAIRSSWVQLDATDLPSNEVANGDEKEDLEVEDERDSNDEVVQDNGFAIRSSWIQIRADLNQEAISKGY